MPSRDRFMGPIEQLDELATANLDRNDAWIDRWWIHSESVGRRIPVPLWFPAERCWGAYRDLVGRESP
jgi:hypothetical protein